MKKIILLSAIYAIAFGLGGKYEQLRNATVTIIEPCPSCVVLNLAQKWGVKGDRAEEVLNLPLRLHTVEMVERADGFNPYEVDFADFGDFLESELTDPQREKWLEYRRLEIGACYEGESDPSCVVELLGYDTEGEE